MFTARVGLKSPAWTRTAGNRSIVSDIGVAPGELNPTVTHLLSVMCTLSALLSLLPARDGVHAIELGAGQPFDPSQELGFSKADAVGTCLNRTVKGGIVAQLTVNPLARTAAQGLGVFHLEQFGHDAYSGGLHVVVFLCQKCDRHEYLRTLLCIIVRILLYFSFGGTCNFLRAPFRTSARLRCIMRSALLLSFGAFGSFGFFFCWGASCA